MSVHWDYMWALNPAYADRTGQTVAPMRPMGHRFTSRAEALQAAMNAVYEADQDAVVTRVVQVTTAIASDYIRGDLPDDFTYTGDMPWVARRQAECLCNVYGHGSAGCLIHGVKGTVQS